MSERNAGESSQPIVSLDDVEVHFGQSDGLLDYFSDVDDDVVRAVDGVSLDIGSNEVVALVGESGCGKTTLGKTAIGLQRPTAGSVSYRGQDIWAAKEGKGNVQIPYKNIRRALQIIHQDPGGSLNPYRRVKASLNEPLRKWHDLAFEDRIARIYSMLETVGMTPPEDYAERYPHQLSGGEQQRVALIRTMLMNPDLILADEGISALDVSLRVEMMELMIELQDIFNTSFLFISHDLSNARYITKKMNGRIGIMYLGRLVEVGPPDEILQNPVHPYTKALRWATPSLRKDDDRGDLPLRTIDVPDPVDPPSGCRFHTRCPEAREICTRDEPPEVKVDEQIDHSTMCYRALEDHEYWDSPPLEMEQGDDDEGLSGATSSS
ncbi:ABC transporter ATP-binding protein [Halomontanus rarus]|uniref:ABC transporter ATP-binding protein n=1 Tax=Halomontanus rarus TaxID=3034020 RepID=UPI0023E8E310|nr:ABC transporter ATP-binding protein [Halovivax sp. TS33]